MQQQQELESAEGRASGLARPYRSHKFRACDHCRRRKTRCIVDRAGQPCYLCRSIRVECVYTKTSRAASAGVAALNTATTVPVPVSGHALSLPQSSAQMQREQQTQSHDGTYGPTTSTIVPESGPGRPDQLYRSSSTQLTSTHIVGPVTAQDARILGEYMSPHTSENSNHTYNFYSANPQKPVLYTRIARRRQGLSPTFQPGRSQRDILEQIIAPFTRQLIDTFFDCIAPSFPVLDLESFKSSYQKNESDLSSALVCEIYAISITYWRNSSQLKDFPPPDPYFAWNLAVRALQDDFLAPGLSTLQAALLDLNGRPITSITGNGVNCGRTVALAYSLGLNRDPTNWKMSSEDRDLRIRLWWAVLIHDRWASLAHGTPPHISSTYHDVPLPTLATLQSSSSDRYRHEKECFISLCELTNILGDVLPLIYDLRNIPAAELQKRLRRIEPSMDDWEDSLPKEMAKPLSVPDNHINGSNSLRLSFLVLKLLLCRVTLHAIARGPAVDTTTRLYHQENCYRSADKIVRFIVSLEKQHLKDFWLPYSAYHFMSTATLLLRCALETEIDSTASACISSTRALVERLRCARQEDDWDLGDICLSQCEGILSRMTSNRETSAPLLTPGQSSLLPAESQRRGRDHMSTPGEDTNAPVIDGDLGDSEQTWQHNERRHYTGDGISILSPPILSNCEVGDRWNTQIPNLWEMLRFDEADFGNFL